MRLFGDMAAILNSIVSNSYMYMGQTHTNLNNRIQNDFSENFKQN